MLLSRKSVSRLASIALATLVAASGVAMAQELDELKQTTPAERAAASSAVMKQKLDLSPEQLTQVKAINLENAEKMDPIIKSSGGRLEKLREARKLGKAKDAELEKVLSTPQYQKYLAEKDAMREKIEKRLMEKLKDAG